MKKIFYFLDIWITKEDYDFFLDKLTLILNWASVIDIVDKYYYKIWENNIWKINKSFFLEALTFIDYSKKELWVDFKNIKWIYKENFLVFNYDFYVFDSEKFDKIDLENTYFVNIRYPWFSHIFRIYKILWWKALWINHKWDWIYNDKLFCISKLYKWKLSKYVWNIIIPFINDFNEKSINLLYNFVISNFWTKEIVLKKSFWEMWNWVKAVNLDTVSIEAFYQIIKNKYLNIYNNVEPFYIVPFYKILAENRIYYLYDKKSNTLEIYSVKQKNTNFNWVFELDSFELYKWIEVTWKYVDKFDVINNKLLFKYIRKIAKLIWYETGVLELWLLSKKDFRFFEVNPYWWSLMFREDQEDMYKFYYNMYINKFNN